MTGACASGEAKGGQGPVAWSEISNENFRPFVWTQTADGILESIARDSGQITNQDTVPDWAGGARLTRNAVAPHRASGRKPPGVPLDVSKGRWLLNRNAVGALVPPRCGRWDGREADAAARRFWLLLDLNARTAIRQRAPYEPAPARQRARALRLDDGIGARAPDARRGR